MTHSNDLSPRAFSAASGAVHSDSGMFLRGFVGSAVLLVAINASEPLFFGEHHFQTLSFHPFWIVILLAAVQHGLFVGLGIAALATLMMDWPPRPVGIDITDHYVNIATTPTQWLIVALLIGIYRQQQLRREQMMDAENTRLMQVNQTLAGEIHRLDAFVARAELAAATQTPPRAASADRLPRPDVAVALDRLSCADAAERPEAFAEAAHACTAAQVVWLLPDDKGELRPAAASHKDPALPGHLTDLADGGVASFASGDGPALAGYHAICHPLTSAGRGALLALTSDEQNHPQIEAVLATLGRALEESLRTDVQPEPAQAHA